MSCSFIATAAGVSIKTLWQSDLLKRSQAVLRMRFSYLAAAAILCSFGYVYPQDLQACTREPGVLYMFRMENHDKNGETSKFTIKGSSGKPPTKLHLRYDIFEVESFVVYDCLAALDAVKRHVMGQYPSATRLDDKWEISFYENLGKIDQLVEEIEDVIVGGTKNGWITICMDDPGFVYIVNETTPTHFYSLGEGYVYQIMGSSGIPRVAMDNPPVTVQIQKIPIKNCQLAIHSIMHDLHEKSSRGILEKPENGWCAFAVATARYDNFLAYVKYATFPLLAEIPPNDWLPCPNEMGFLYIMRIARRVDTNQEYDYYCHQIFGSQYKLLETSHNNIKITAPYFECLVVGWAGVTDCAAALRKAKDGVLNAGPNEKKWEHVSTTEDEDGECYRMLLEETDSLQHFDEAIVNATKEYFYKIILASLIEE